MADDMALAASGTGPAPSGLSRDASQAKPLVPSADDFFPFTVRAIETSNWTKSPYDFRGTFLRAKGDLQGWYAYDVCVVAPDEVEFIVYDMRCNVYGGIGKVIAKFTSPVSPDVVGPSIDKQARRLARSMRDAELQAAEDAIVSAYAKAILASAMSASGQDPQGLEAKPASATGNAGDANTSPEQS